MNNNDSWQKDESLSRHSNQNIWRLYTRAIVICPMVWRTGDLSGSLMASHFWTDSEKAVFSSVQFFSFHVLKDWRHVFRFSSIKQVVIAFLPNSIPLIMYTSYRCASNLHLIWTVHSRRNIGYFFRAWITPSDLKCCSWLEAWNFQGVY